MTLFAELSDWESPLVREGLTRTCTICKAPPGEVCRHPWETSEPLGRIVHLCRAQAHMDKRH